VKGLAMNGCPEAVISTYADMRSTFVEGSRA
jgi:pentatricopeptide repeat protein